MSGRPSLSARLLPVLAVLLVGGGAVALDFAVPKLEPHEGVHGLPGVAALTGFCAGVVMLLVGWAMRFLKRSEPPT